MAGEVQDEESFQAFLDALVEAARTDGSGLEQISAADFLEAAAAWARDSRFGREFGLEDEWPRFAAFLFMGFAYE